MASEDLKGLFRQLRASHGSSADQVQGILDRIQAHLGAKSDLGKMLLWQALAGPELPKMLQSKSFTDEALRDRDPKMRMAALLLLGERWPSTAELREQCERLAFNDPDLQVRALALGQIGSLYKGTNDPRIGAMLATIVCDSSAPANLRRSAYFSLYRLRSISLFPLFQTGVMKKDLNFPEECDWDFVKSFVRGGV